MATTTTPAPGTRRPDFTEVGVRRGEVDVLGLDDDAVLAAIAEHRTMVRRAEVAELRAVAAYADRHRVTEGEWLTRGALSRDGLGPRRPPHPGRLPGPRGR